MNRLSFIARCVLTVAIVLVAEPYVHAATIQATERKGYGRINFQFGAPAKLQTSSNGTTVVLKFDAPLTQSAESIKTSLPDYVEAATISADNRMVTLTLNKPMRLRQFKSGNGVGVDLIDPNPGETIRTARAPEEPTGDAIITIKKEVIEPVGKPKKPSEIVKAKAEAKKIEKPLVVATTPKTVTISEPAPVADNAILTTKKPEPTAEPIAETPPPAILKPEPASVAAPAQPDILTTKKPEPAPSSAVDEDVAEAKAPAPAEAAPKPAAATPAPETQKVETPDPAPEAVPEPAPAVAQAPEKKTEPEGPFLVTARTAENQTTINFPWDDRTAAAIFENARDIWIVFSRARDVNAGLLRTVMPKQVVSLTQYAYKGNTVIRIVTDGTLHANAVQLPNYQWNVMLASSLEKPLQEVTVSVDSLQSTLRIVLGVFDISAPLRFYDPNSGEQLFVIPAYENRAVSTVRNFPQFSVLSGAQGAAILSKRPDISITQSRTGVIVSSEFGLAVSESLPLLSGTTPVVGASATSSVALPYDQWFVMQGTFMNALLDRVAAMANATKATKPDSMLELVKLYLSRGMGAEAAGLLTLIKTEYPDYYKVNTLGMLNAAAQVLVGHMDTAATELMAPELNDREEAQLWRQVVALYAPALTSVETAQQAIADKAAAAGGSDAVANTPKAEAAAAAAATAAPPRAVQKPVFQYLKFNKSFIRFYPPALRQRLALIAADAYIADGQEEKAVAVYDALSKDNILGLVSLQAEFALAKAAEKKSEFEPALEILDRLSEEKADRYIAVRASYTATMIRYRKLQITAEEAANILEHDRIIWRGDGLEVAMLESLIGIYKDIKRYDEVLRTQRALLEAFPNHPDTIAISGETAELFEKIFLDDLANDLPPLKALSLFYEFRELTPLGDKGDIIIQKLADRLAAIDLLDRATQLLENQIKFRSTGESRSKIGARLALLHLLNKHPQEALNVLEVTNYGQNTPELQLLRRQLMAEALTKLGKNEEALGILYNDTSPVGAQLRLNVLWAMKDWTNVINRAEDMLTGRPNLTEILTTSETETLLKLALAYCFEGDYTQLRYLRDYYSGLIPDTAYKQIFDFITNDTTPLDPEDFEMLAQQINRTESFLDMFKAKIAAGKLSETIK